MTAKSGESVCSKLSRRAKAPLHLACRPQLFAASTTLTNTRKPPQTSRSAPLDSLLGPQHTVANPLARHFLTMDVDHPKREEDDLDIDLDPSSSAADATAGAGEGGDDGDEDAEKEAQELAAMKARVAEMEREAQLLRDMTAKADSEQDANGQGAMGDDEKEAVDQRSIYVGNVSCRPIEACGCPGADSKLPFRMIRSITRPHPRRSRRTLRRAAPSTA